MNRPTWSHWWQLRDIAPVVLCAVVLVGFLALTTVFTAHLVVVWLASFVKHWNQP